MNDNNRSNQMQEDVQASANQQNVRRDRLFAVQFPKRPHGLAAIFSDTSISYLTRIAENPRMPPSLLEQLSFHSHASVREAVADNINTPTDTLWTLACDESSDVRYAMAENHNLPLAILTLLADDDNPYVSSRAQNTIERLSRCGTVVVGAFERIADDDQAHSA